NRTHYKSVINATGVVLHTNLGRAPLPAGVIQSLTEKMSGYSNLEFDLQNGIRGERYAHFEKLICKITGAEAAMVVNNNASAVLLMLAAVGRDGEVIVSRGEQVEIGGKFRIPDIMDLSGCERIEVGTTNKTRLSDYEERITERTKALLKVHQSNFRMEGFTESVSREELVELGRKHGIPIMEDLGSGILIDLSKYGMKKEPTVQESIKSGMDLVSFSGDKLLGGPQAGVIVGKADLIQRCKKHAFTRAVRIDKFTAAVLEQLFLYYEDEYRAIKEIPVLRMLTESKESVKLRADRLAECIAAMDSSGLSFSVVECESTAGGGSLPGEVMESYGLMVSYNSLSADLAAGKLRTGRIPVVCRIVDEKLLFDIRTVFDDDIEKLSEAICGVLS
ncbi:MAG: L-seryl-tRNA(Sec) selenium transferase, partial [Lachnospiraceae bacterium]|nr:L-seryl-tRNA(Sec) selenium transferase [Lachnospiraceae bacterium]